MAAGSGFPPPRISSIKTKQMMMIRSQPTFNNLGEEHYKNAIADMLRTDMQLIEVEANLAVLEQAIQASKAEDGHQGLSADEGLNALIEEEFKKDPEVVGVIGEITEVKRPIGPRQRESATVQ